MFTKPQLQNFRTDFEKTVKELEKKYSVKIEIGSISYSDNSFHTKMTCTSTTEDGKKIIDTSKFEMYKELFGLKANLGDTYTTKGITFTIYDIDDRKSKYPVLTMGSDGKRYKAPVDYVNHMVGKD
jgi:hypothetical protein